MAPIDFSEKILFDFTGESGKVLEEDAIRPFQRTEVARMTLDSAALRVHQGIQIKLLVYELKRTKEGRRKRKRRSTILAQGI